MSSKTDFIAQLSDHDGQLSEITDFKVKVLKNKNVTETRRKITDTNKIADFKKCYLHLYTNVARFV